eukprot:TRINITY_DN24723_c0_g1_i1.p1 TRINITY_DN24723_c0_g1~~TRINITY_DN24723_c0_g1_i1.p1  ORF type:complete len:135 (+),score=7.25 TRINITY_DN24723_c0_g1_i1:311-715(+)
MATQPSGSPGRHVPSEFRPHMDVHFYFAETSDSDTESALRVRDAFRKAFPKLRVYEPVRRPVGPHPIGMWEAHIVREDLPDVLPWLMVNHGHHSVLIHPHTGNHLKDHTDHAVWLGTRQPLNTSIFQHAPSTSA